MSERTVVVERDLPHRPDKVWRALTLPHLIAEWLAPGDFDAVPGHRCAFRFDWGSVECRVCEAEPGKRLSYTWESGDLRSTVTWTLTPTDGGTRLRMEQAGFPADQPRYLMGARTGWPRLFQALADVLAREVVPGPACE